MFKFVIYTVLSIFENSPPRPGQPPVADVAEVLFALTGGFPPRAPVDAQSGVAPGGQIGKKLPTASALHPAFRIATPVENLGLEAP